MENEYANFGLPSGSANEARQPYQTDPAQRGCFFRNLWWMLPAAFLVLVLPCGCCGGIFVWFFHSLKSSEPYQMAMERVRTDPRVIEQIGKPVEESSWMPTGNFSYHIVNGVASGEATFDFNVAGPRGTAHVHAQASCRDGKWRFLQLQVTPASTGRVISLPVDDEPEKAEKEDGAN